MQILYKRGVQVYGQTYTDGNGGIEEDRKIFGQISKTGLHISFSGVYRSFGCACRYGPCSLSPNEEVDQWRLCTSRAASIEIIVINAICDHATQRRGRAPRRRPWGSCRAWIPIAPCGLWNPHSIEAVDRLYCEPGHVCSTEPRQGPAP